MYKILQVLFLMQVLARWHSDCAEMKYLIFPIVLEAPKIHFPISSENSEQN